MANFLKSLFVKGVEIDTAGAITGDVLKYNGTKFGAASAGGGGSSVGALDDLSDVVITSPYKYQSLIYDGTNWINDDASTITYVSNAESTTLNVGEVVYLYQQQGDRASVKRAINTSDATSAKTLGVVAASIAANASGPVVTQGYVTGCTLGSFTAGQTVYLSASAGAITSTKPYAPNHLVYIGVVVRANNGNGILYVRAQNGYELDEIHDVDLTTTPPTAGQYLRFGGTVWTADTIDLGTDTTGDYVGTITAGTGVTTSGASTGEGIAHSISIGQSVATSATPQFAGGLFIGDTTVQSATGRDRIVLRGRAGGTSNYGMFVTTDTLTVSRQIVLPDTNGTVVTTGDTGTVTSTMLLDGTIVNADINTSAAIALSKLASGTSAQVVIANGSGVPTYTTISGDITISNTGVATIAADSVALGTDTTGNYVGTITAGTGIATSGASTGEGIAHSISLASGVATIGTYKSVTVDTYGRVTAGTNPTTLAGYGITDAQKAITISDTAPGSPAAGNLWYKSDTGAMYVYYDSFWIEVGSPSSGLDGGSA